MKTTKELIQETRNIIENQFDYNNVKFTNFEMQFEIGSAVFGENGDPADAAKILHRVANILKSSSTDESRLTGEIIDENGVKRGSWKLT